MLGDFIIRCLVLLLGYAYPAFECFKSVEKNRVNIEELRFWCQYWIIVAFLTVCESIGDIFISWLPMYGEAKLAFIIYLWYPKTKGSGYIYESLLRPYMAKHETDIERKVKELHARAWDFAIYYWTNCTELGQTKFFEILQYLVNQSGKFSSSSTKKVNKYEPSAPPAPEDMIHSPSATKQRSNHSRWPSKPPSGSINRLVVEPTESERVQVNLYSQTEAVKVVESTDTNTKAGHGHEVADNVNGKLNQARMKLRRSKPN